MTGTVHVTRAQQEYHLLYLSRPRRLNQALGPVYTFTMADPPMKSSLPDAEKLEVINDTHGTNIDPAAEKKLLRKCDLHVLPPLFVLFLLAFLDRTNIGKTPEISQGMDGILMSL